MSTDDKQTGALVWCPFPDEATALGAIKVLLGEGLIACGNVIGPMTSAFMWDGKADTAREYGALLKTNAALLDRAVGRLSLLHPYDEPAVLGWRCDSGAKGTLAWLAGIHPAP